MTDVTTDKSYCITAALRYEFTFYLQNWKKASFMIIGHLVRLVLSSADCSNMSPFAVSAD